MINCKSHTSKCCILALALYLETLCGICIFCHDGNRNYTLVQEHVHRVNTFILGLQFVYTSTCMQARLGVYVTDIHTCSCKLSYTHLVCTQVLCTKASMSAILCANTCIYASEM